MLVSRTTRTRGVHLLVDQVEDVLLVIPRIAILNLAHGQIQHAANILEPNTLRQPGGRVSRPPDRRQKARRSPIYAGGRPLRFSSEAA